MIVSLWKICKSRLLYEERWMVSKSTSHAVVCTRQSWYYAWRWPSYKYSGVILHFTLLI